MGPASSRPASSKHRTKSGSHYAIHCGHFPEPGIQRSCSVKSQDGPKLCISSSYTIFLRAKTQIKHGIMFVTDRHVPGSQSPFSLIPDPDQNKEAISFFCVVTYGVFITLSHPIQFCHLTNQKSRKMPKILQILRNPGSKIRVGFYRFSWGSNHVIKEIPCHIKHYIMDNQAQNSEIP